MKNYYKILEIDKNASKEIIDKAYKTLVKKYHPDLKENLEKEKAEKKIKEINEAYDILSDKNKKANYDKIFQNNFIPIDKYNLLIEENNKLKIELNNIKNNYNNYNNYFNKYNNPYQNNSNYEQNYFSHNIDTNNHSENYTNYNNVNYNQKNYNYTKNSNSDFINELFNYKIFNKKIPKNKKDKLIPFFIFLTIIIISQIPILRETLFSTFPGSILILIIVIAIILYL